MRTIAEDKVVRVLEAPRSSPISSRALVSALSLMTEESEKNSRDAVESAVKDVEKRMAVLLAKTERVRGEAEQSIRKAVDRGLEQMTAALRARDLAGAESLVDKLNEVLRDARVSQREAAILAERSILAAVQEILTEQQSAHREVLAAISNIRFEPAKRTGFSVTVASRDDSGRAKSLKVIPDNP